MSSKAKVSITKPVCGQDRRVRISIDDEASSNRVAELDMSLADFADCVTGLSGVSANFLFRPSPESAKNYGLKRVTKDMFCERVFEKDKQRGIVLAELLGNSEWSLFNDGIGTQQNGEKHRFVVVKYVEDNADE